MDNLPVRLIVLTWRTTVDAGVVKESLESSGSQANCVYANSPREEKGCIAKQSLIQAEPLWVSEENTMEAFALVSLKMRKCTLPSIIFVKYFSSEMKY